MPKINCRKFRWMKRILKYLFGEPSRKDVKAREMYDNIFQPKIKDGDE